MKRILIILVSIFICSSAFSQTADFIQKMLDTEKATVGQVCYISAVNQGLIDATESEEEAVTAVFENDSQNTNMAASKIVTYEQAAYILSKAWNVQGGLLFKLTKKSPRYAFRQLKIDGIIPQKKDPYSIPSGRDILNLFSSCEEKYNPSTTPMDFEGDAE